MLETLIYRNAEGMMEPLLAERWEVSADSTVFTFHIRQGVKFHDGEPLNAEAVKVNFDRMMDPDAATAQPLLVKPIKELTVVDEYTLKLEATSSFGPMLSNLTNPVMAIQSPKMLKAHWTETVTETVGTGPFMWKEWVPGDHVTMVQNPDYWGEKAKLDTLTFKIIPDAGARLMSLEAGEIDVCISMPPRDAPRVEADPNLTVDRSPSLRNMHVGFNLDKAPFTDVRVRQALNYAINKEAIVKYVVGGVGTVADCPIAAGIFGYAPTMTYEYNPEKAKALLAEAGYPDGFECNFYPPVGRYLMDVETATAITADLYKVGVKAKIVMMDIGTLISFLRPANREDATYDMYMLGIGSGNMDADYESMLLLHSDWFAPSGLNITYYENPEAEALMEAAGKTADEAERLSLYTELWPIVMEDAPWLFLHTLGQITGLKTNVKGLVMHPKEFVRAHNAWIE